MNTEEAATSSDDERENVVWGPNSPRGGQVVMGRILKENATVPLFFGQTMIQSLRDMGYNDTTSALCEHVDNSIQAGANEIRVYFRQSGRRGAYQIDAAVYDDGRGMSPTLLKVASAFGGSTTFGNRDGIGRYGMGMKTAALSMSPVVEIYSWQEPRAFYSMTLDVEEIGKDRRNLVELPDPTLIDELPDEVADVLRHPMVYPKRPEDQTLLVGKTEAVAERLGRSGTIDVPPGGERLPMLDVEPSVVQEVGAF